MALPDINAMLASDYEMIDAAFKVSVTVTNPDAVSWTAGNALRYNRSAAWGESGGAGLPGGTVVFCLWVSECSARPKLSGQLVHGSINYRIMDVDDVAANTRYDVTCVPESYS